MDLQELKFNKTITGILRRKHWTVDKLATASVIELVRLPGIGTKTAEGVIAKAKEIVNQRGLEESQHLDNYIPEATKEDDIKKPEVVKMEEVFLSVRQRRILEAYEQQQKEDAG